MGEVVEIGCVTKLDVPAEKILRKSIEAELLVAVVIGYRDDGSLYFASTKADGGEVLWLIEKAKFELLKAGGVL